MRTWSALARFAWYIYSGARELPLPVSATKPPTMTVMNRASEENTPLAPVQRLCLAVSVFIMAVSMAGCGSAEEDAARSAAIDNHVTLGIAYLELHRFEDADEQFSSALTLDPDNADTRTNLAIAYYHRSNYSQALETITVSPAPDDAHARFVTGAIHLKGNRPQQAIASFSAALPSPDPYLHFYLALANEETGNTGEAEESYRQAIQLDPLFRLARERLGGLLNKRGADRDGEMELLAADLIGINNRFHVVESELVGRDGFLKAARYPDNGIRRQTLLANDLAFSNVTLNSGFAGTMPSVSSGGGTRDRNGPQEVLRTREPSPTLLDFNRDGHLDLFVVRSQPQGTSRLFINNGDGTFTDGTEAAGIARTDQAMAATAGDYDNDGNIDLLISNPGSNVLYHNNGDGTFEDVTHETGSAGEHSGPGASFVDVDYDGFLDLLELNTDGDNVLYRNDGKGAFLPMERAFVGKGMSVSSVISDLDYDRDMDILVSNPLKHPQLFANNRDGSFTDIAASTGLTGIEGTWGATVADFNGDQTNDILFLSARCDANRLLFGNGPDFAESATQDLGRGGDSVSSLDYDNDGDRDVIISGTCGGGHRLYENRGDGTFVNVTRLLPANGSDANPGSFALGDYDNDGDSDVFLVEDGAVTLLRNNIGNLNNWLNVALIGMGQNNRSGIGAVVKVVAGDTLLEREVNGLISSSSQGYYDLHFGIGSNTHIEQLKVTWPDGKVWSTMDLQPNHLERVDQEGVKSSCPFLFTWDGSKYSFVTDFLGAGFIGILTGPNTYYKPDPDEFLKVDRGLLRPKDGEYRIKLTEQLEEVDYLDQVKLVVVDHPIGVDVYPNEMFRMSPPFPEAKTIAVANSHPPVSAIDDNGNDILPLISAIDRRYPKGFPIYPYMGYALRHSITLDLGDLSGTDSIVLLLNGWVRYWNSNSAYNASTRGINLEQPSLEVRDGNGEWVKVIDDMGFPAGLPKNITADLSDAFLTNDYAVRITTNMEIYWDQITVATDFADASEIAVTELAPRTAMLGWLGFPEPFSADGKAPFEFDYDTVSDKMPWRSQKGNYTRYGDVTSLLEITDDKFVIMAPGEEISIAFAANGLPMLKPGQSRDFFVYVDGFVKEMNPHTAHLQSVQPLPFHGMSNYPYGKDESYPFDEEHNQYIEQFNQRTIE